MIYAGTDTDAFQFHSGLIKSKTGEAIATIISAFQFHSGLIKRKTTRNIEITITEFQFHSGLIKSLSLPTMLKLKK